MLSPQAARREASWRAHTLAHFLGEAVSLPGEALLKQQGSPTAEATEVFVSPLITHARACTLSAAAPKRLAMT